MKQHYLVMLAIVGGAGFSMAKAVAAAPAAQPATAPAETPQIVEMKV